VGSCEGCLEDTGGMCVWTPAEGCLSSCDNIADTACFPSADYNAADVCDDSEPEDSPPVGSPPPSNATSSAGTVRVVIGLVATFVAAAIIGVY